MRALSDRSGWRDTPAGSLLVLNSMLAYLVFIVLYGLITQVRSMTLADVANTRRLGSPWSSSAVRSPRPASR